MTPAGGIELWTTPEIPPGYLICDGSAVSRTDYADLFAVIGELYGAGDGVDTFNLPDMTGNVPAMGTAGETSGQREVTISDEQMHEHSHSVQMASRAAHGHSGGSFSGASFSTGVSGTTGSGGQHNHSYNGHTTAQKYMDGGGSAGANMYFTNTNARTNSTGAHTHSISASATASVSGGNVNVNNGGGYTPSVNSNEEVGEGEAISVVQPTLSLSYIIKT